MNQKKLKIDFTNVKKIISTISIDKWILMGIAGVVLVFCSDSCNPLGENQNNGSNVNNNAYSYKADNKNIKSDEYIEKLERRLEDILESVDGAGNVKVMVTLKSSSRKEVLTEEPYTEKKVNEITKEERKNLVTLIKNWEMTITGTRSFREAIITQGGVQVKQVNPSTMESRVIPGLFLAGEMLDIDALTGGFNLQLAWSTGYLAGNSLVE